MTDDRLQASTPPAALRGIVIGLLVAFAVATGFAFHERNTAKRLSAQNGQISASLADTRGQIETLNSKLNTLEAARTAPVEPPKPVAVVHTRAQRPPRRVRRDDPRWKKFQTQLDAQGKQIEDTRQDLATSRTELQGSIARTHDELVLLQKKGERSYYEFDLDKAKQFQAKGPVGIRLKKANTKHQYADLELMVDDVKLSQKHVNLYQPVVFYAADNGRPVELVVNSIRKNHIHGYVSEPKYRQSELAAMAPTNNAVATTSNAAPAAAPAASDNGVGSTASKSRQRLQLPK